MNKLVVITTPYFFADEASLIELLFAEGMSRLHLRKPDCKRDELEGLLEQDHDGCVFLMEEGRLAYSTDSFVVDPIFFPGGDIGDLAINGTVNDLACCGARPLYLTAGFILEEGLASRPILVVCAMGF